MQSEDTRVCSYCQGTYPISEFRIGTRRCRLCVNAYSRAYRQTLTGAVSNKAVADAHYQRGKALLEKLKSGPCVDCGGTYIPRAMHFDHRDPAAKTVNISRLAASNRVKAMLAEVAKCDLVCCLCHAYRTERQVQAGLVKAGRPRIGES